MLKGNIERRMVWLLLLMIVTVSAWFLEVKVLSYACGAAFMLSVMQYLDAFTQQSQRISRQMQQPVTAKTSSLPLYLAAMLMLFGVMIDSSWVMALGGSLWLYFLLAWLRRLESRLTILEQQQLPQERTESQQQNIAHFVEASLSPDDELYSRSFLAQIKQWIFVGNPVLKVAILILVVGIILFLRFAIEHWQFSLAIKLLLVSALSFAVLVLGYALCAKNRSFALALEGLGLAGLCLSLFFAYYSLVIADLSVAGLCFVLIMLLTLYLSLKQKTIELAIMAMLIAYIAPFTLPLHRATAIELLSYYLLINSTVAILTSLRPWKLLNQIAFLMTVFVGGGYAFFYAELSQRTNLTILLLLHTFLFIWLGFRFSQLLAKKNLQQFNLHPILDLALIFAAPIVAYLALYLMYFQQMYWQAGFSLAFAVLFFLLYRLSLSKQAWPWIGQSYLSLMQIFLLLIPPVLLVDRWSIAGWSIEGWLIFSYAVYKHHYISRYLAMGLLLMAGISGLFYLDQYDYFSNQMYWLLAASYFASVFMAYRFMPAQQITAMMSAFLALLMFSATVLLFILLADELSGPLTDSYSLVAILVFYVILNEALQRYRSWGWQLAKWVGLIPIYAFAFMLIYSKTEHGMIIWQSLWEQGLVLCSGLLLSCLWLRPVVDAQVEKEWVSLGLLSSLAFASLSLIPTFPYLSVVILPLIFCAYCYFAQAKTSWHGFLQARMSLILMLLWMVSSQLFASQVLSWYWIPILNPFDMLSIAILIVFIWMLLLQIETGLDQAIAAVLAVLALLWLSSYIVLRALHVYLATPLDTSLIWSDAIIQLSFTLLWATLALITMRFATSKQIKALWILGSSILCIVTFKLVLLDLSHIGTLTRVISFLAAGLIMLIIAYIAPMPTNSQSTIGKKPK